MSNSGDYVGCGGIFRNASRDFLFAFTHKLDRCSILEAKLLSIYHGVCMAWARGYHNFVVESNSSVAIGLLKADTSGFHSLDELIKGIKNITTIQRITLARSISLERQISVLID